MFDLLTDVILDTLKILPFLFLTYLAMEYLEHRMGSRAAVYLAEARWKGPLIGAAVGVVPQCGFSATAAGFYSGGLLTAGTLLAVFLSTSDEMIPVMLGSSIAVTRILKILAWKVVIASLTGLLVDFIFRKRKRAIGTAHHISDLCHDENCSCGDHKAGLLRPALRHTLKTILFVFLISYAAGLLIDLIGEASLTAFLTKHQVSGIFLAALIGLIPNCAASVMITTLFASGLITTGQLMAGLLVSAGVGVAVLFRNNRHCMAENLKLTGILYASGVIWGLMLMLLHVEI